VYEGIEGLDVLIEKAAYESEVTHFDAHGRAKG
jgi:hypothetical protein